MNKLKTKAYGEAYDKLYDLSSRTNYKYEKELEILKKDVKKEGYEFVLNNKSQKFKCRRLDK